MGQTSTKHRSDPSLLSFSLSSSADSTLYFHQQDTMDTTMRKSSLLRQRLRRRFHLICKKRGKKLKSSSRPPPELYRLAHYGSFESFLSRLHSHPSETKAKVDDGLLSIYSTNNLSSSSTPSFNSFPESGSRNGAASHTQILEYGSTPLHLLFTRRPQPPTFIVQQYLSIHPQSAHCMTFRHGRLPIHVATYSSTSPETIQLLVESFPESVNVCDYYGWNVFHIAARFGVPDRVLKALISSSSSSSAPISSLDKAMRARDNDGRTPLHIGTDYFAAVSLDDFRTVLSLAPDVSFMETNTTKIALDQTKLMHSSNIMNIPFDIPKKRTQDGGQTPLEMLCREYTTTIMRVKHLVESFQQQWKHKDKEEGDSSEHSWKIEHLKFAQKLFVDIVELREFWDKSLLLVQAMHDLFTSNNNQHPHHDHHEEDLCTSTENKDFTMLHSCLSLSPTWCPNLLTLISVLLRPNEVSMICGPQRNLPLHIAANVVASAASRRQLELDEQKKCCELMQKRDHHGSQEKCQEEELSTITAVNSERSLNASRKSCFSLDDTLHSHPLTFRDIFDYQIIVDDTEANETIIDTIVDCYPEAASIPNGEGYLPLQLIVGNKCLGAHDTREKERLGSRIKEDEECSDKMNNEKLLMRIKKKQPYTSSPTWSEGVGTILLAYPPALESLCLSEKLYPSLFARFTGAPVDIGHRSTVEDLTTLFILLKQRPELLLS
mmetsp:Transcript_20621/g.30638  ORF Transcript_20621/g.30638 Transcript_20621/m.30638 type:complete len:718 (-) Transcript_20621:427-2580(-)